MRIPKEQADSISADQKGFYSSATGFGWDDYGSLLYRVDLGDGRQVWVHARQEYLDAGWGGRGARDRQPHRRVELVKL